MQPSVSLLLFASLGLAARPYLEEPDTGIDLVLGKLPEGTLPELSSIVGLPDFQWVAQRYPRARDYTAVRTRASFPIATIWRRLSVIGFVLASLWTLCARGEYGHPDAEINLAQVASEENILYTTIEEIGKSKSKNQTI
ncbi:hypothetical protein PWT90_06503 [Aphanocladium album]|nr:hypothetical protein PWT90_06503 [Aphanocladium album]